MILKEILHYLPVVAFTLISCCSVVLVRKKVISFLNNSARKV